MSATNAGVMCYLLSKLLVPVHRNHIKGRPPKGQSRMENPEKLETLDIQDENKQSKKTTNTIRKQNTNKV